MINRWFSFIGLIFLILSFTSESKTLFSLGASYDVCFTPSENCTGLIVSALSQAKKNILVQAYSFTSYPIAKALVDAHLRGVEVKIILDKTQLQSRYTIPQYLFNKGIPIWLDIKPKIAHNKIMLIDNHIVITGSFNFTNSAEKRNTENLILIDDLFLAKRYKENWIKRQRISEILEGDYGNDYILNLSELSE